MRQIDVRARRDRAARLPRLLPAARTTSSSSASSHDIYCQGRGSAANSAVCYALGVTKADAVALGLLFERFLSTERDGPPDIDLDIEHQRREEVIQYVYERYGRDRAAQVANVITYRPTSALREMAKVAGLSPGHADAITKLDRPVAARRTARSHDWSAERARTARARSPQLVLELAEQVQDFPRHLGIHSGGMVMADRPLVECCPIEWARMEGRSVLQWDKDDCAAAGLVKFDLLGLGMLTMLHLAVDLIREHEEVEVDLATIPQEDEVYDLLCAADTIGVFQVESRAQMATLPRLRPRDVLRPRGGGRAHPARADPGRLGAPVPAPAQRRGGGHLPAPAPRAVPAQDARRAAVPGAAHADGDRRRGLQPRRRPTSCARRWARSGRRRAWPRMRDRLMEGMAERGITGETAEEIAKKLEAFASFGFPESHSVSFAYLVYSSSWIKLHYPAEFVCALLNAQPMGFYSPHTLVRDAVRHGVRGARSRRQRGRARDCTLEPRTAEAGPVGHPAPGWHADPSHPRGADRAAVRARAVATRCSTASTTNATPSRSATSRTSPAAPARRSTRSESLATAGAFGVLRAWTGGRRCGPRGALRDAQPDDAAGRGHRDRGAAAAGDEPIEETDADLWATGMSPGRHPTEFVREELTARGVVTAAALRELPHRTVVEVAGVVTHRQQPETAKGDDLPQPRGRDRADQRDLHRGGVEAVPEGGARLAGVCVRGLLERHQGVINLLAQRIEPLDLRPAALLRSRDFH